MCVCVCVYVCVCVREREIFSTLEQNCMVTPILQRISFVILLPVGLGSQLSWTSSLRFIRFCHCHLRGSNIFLQVERRTTRLNWLNAWDSLRPPTALSVRWARYNQNPPRRPIERFLDEGKQPLPYIHSFTHIRVASHQQARQASIIRCAWLCFSLTCKWCRASLSRTHVHARSHTHAGMHTHTHTHLHTHARTHARTHAHTVLILFFSF